MPNPFKSYSQNTSGGFAQLKEMMQMLNSAQNPQAALNMLAQKNPQMAQVMSLVHGKNPQEVFYAMCQQKGVNPEEILSQLR